MRRRSFWPLATLVLLGAASCSSAQASRLFNQQPPATMATTDDGFPEVVGPSGAEPEHAGQFASPPPAGPCVPCTPQPAPPNQPPPARH